MNRAQLIGFVRQRGLAVIATRGPDGAPQAALVGVTATDHGEVVFDTAVISRKYANICADPRVALVIGGWDDEVTLQGQGHADVLAGPDRERCMNAYLRQYPDGRRRAADPEVVLVRIRLDWARVSDYRPETFGSDVLDLGP